MKKHSIIAGALCLGVFISTASIGTYEHKRIQSLGALFTSNDGTSSQPAISSKSSDSKETITSKATDKDYLFATSEDFSKTQGNTSGKPELNSSAQEGTIIASRSQDSRAGLSRGGNPPAKSDSNNSGASTTATSKKVELLDWWKEAQYAFPINSVATVRDVYTGKTFKIKRTMGTNHADSEALTKEDTNIIKSIWGGFTWNVRPVHILINGRVLAASMSAMPHAGLDSAPAFATVDNRSQGYGRGQNLDVIKGNGMDGHFDVHFLNSTRHKDGKKDPRHQEAIKIAAGK